MATVFDADAPRKAVNLTVNSDLLHRARALKINLSRTLEVALVSEMKKREQAEWLAANRAAIEGYNELVEGEGVFSDGLRSF
ncbi:type II toxin-antitoxin system CcdA family antitoxin [Thioalkalivibrio sp. XN8]|nr:type II toxin-antitoxin system CcdA family antitoxin [Thioalkalivibrio sp. XN8]